MGPVHTIVVVDLVGYSTISDQLEQSGGVGLVTGLNQQIQGLVDLGLAAARVTRNQAVIKTSGDGAILKLASVEIAHRFSATLQFESKNHNSARTVPSAKRLFRVGVATGEIDETSSDGITDIAGTTISRAARLEAAARPGGVLVDAATYSALPYDLQGLYEGPKNVTGKRNESFAAYHWQANKDARQDAGYFEQMTSDSNQKEGGSAGIPGSRVGTTTESIDSDGGSAPQGESLDHDSLLDEWQRRLSDPYRMPEFKGPWCDALVHELRALFPEWRELDLEVGSVFGCFRSARPEEVDQLFAAIASANQAVAPSGDAAEPWAVSLISFAAMRCLDLTHWSGFERNESDPLSRNAVAGEVPAASAVLANIGVAALLGQVIRLEPGARLRGAFELKDLAPHADDYKQLVLRQLYDSLPSNPKRHRINPNNPIGNEELGVLRQYFREQYRRGKHASVFIRPPPVLARQRREGNEAIARAINATVIQGASENDDQLVHKSTGYTVEELKEEIENRFSELVPKISSRKSNATKPNPLDQYLDGHERHLFISHASDDKPSFVTPLCAELDRRLVSYWLDENELTAGDGLMQSIDAGLKTSRFGVVVLSKAFFAKSWPSNELAALFSSQLRERKKRLIPVCHGMTHDEASSISPLLGDLISLSSGSGVEAVADDIVKAIMKIA